MKSFSRHRAEVNENVVFVFKLAHLYLLKLCNKPVCGCLSVWFQFWSSDDVLFIENILNFLL